MAYPVAELPVEELPCPEDVRLDRTDRELQHIGYLFVGPFFAVAEQDHPAVLFGKLVYRLFQKHRLLIADKLPGLIV